MWCKFGHVTFGRAHEANPRSPPCNCVVRMLRPPSPNHAKSSDQAVGKRVVKSPRHEAAPPSHLAGEAEADQLVVNKKIISPAEPARIQLSTPIPRPEALIPNLGALNPLPTPGPCYAWLPARGLPEAQHRGTPNPKH